MNVFVHQTLLSIGTAVIIDSVHGKRYNLAFANNEESDQDPHCSNSTYISLLFKAFVNVCIFRCDRSDVQVYLDQDFLEMPSCTFCAYGWAQLYK